MSIFAKVTAPTKPKSANVKQISIMFAVILSTFVIAQLATFEGFIRVIDSYGLPGGQYAPYFLGSFIVFAEIFALPFLLRMRTSTAFRIFSMICGWIVPSAWAKLGLWLVITDTSIENVGFLGDLVNLIPGWWNIMFSLALGVLAVWASWGMWPKLKPRRK